MRYLFTLLLLLGLGYLVRQRKHDRITERWLKDEYRRSLNRDREMPECVGGGWPLR